MGLNHQGPRPKGEWNTVNAGQSSIYRCFFSHKTSILGISRCHVDIGLCNFHCFLSRNRLLAQLLPKANDGCCQRPTGCRQWTMWTRALRWRFWCGLKPWLNQQTWWIWPTRIWELTSHDSMMVVQTNIGDPTSRNAGIWEDVLRRWLRRMVNFRCWVFFTGENSWLHLEDSRWQGWRHITDLGWRHITDLGIWNYSIFTVTPRFFVWIRTCAGKIM